MDFSHLIGEILRNLWHWWWLILAAIVASALNTPIAKGFFGELAIRLFSRLRLDKELYRPIHNVTLPTPDGTTQIDHVFVSPYGIFVVETKNMSGWIFGSERDKQWTQKIYRHTSRFQNPLHQNYKHTKALENLLGVPAETIHSVVAFIGDSSFKTDMPPNVTEGGGYIRYIKSFRNPIFTATQVDDLVRRIKRDQLKPTLATHLEHVERLQMRSDTNVERLCPKCGSQMVLRTARFGSNAGRKFWGCSAFPKCRVVQNS